MPGWWDALLLATHLIDDRQREDLVVLKHLQVGREGQGPRSPGQLGYHDFEKMAHGALHGPICCIRAGSS